MSAEFDTVIRGGLVADGRGGEPYVADVAVLDGRIAEVGQVAGKGREEIDARGKLVTPGFIDIHTHYDGQAIWSKYLAPSSSHGVTTVVMGNCGVGFAPCRPADHDVLVSVMEGVEDIPGAVMAVGLPWTWETFPEYLDALDARQHDIDVAAYLPHSPLRVYVMGKRGADREAATEKELADMKRLTREAMNAGAIGFATSRTLNHRTSAGETIPSQGAADREILAIAQGLHDAGRGVMQVVTQAPRVSFTEEIAWLRDVSKKTGVPTIFTFGTPNQKTDSWKSELVHLKQANADGASVTAQIFTRPIGMILSFNLSVNPFSLCPSYQPFAGMQLPDKMKYLRRPDVRERLLREGPGPSPSVLAKIGRTFDYMFAMGESPQYEPKMEDSIGAQARRLGVSPESLAYDMLLEKEGNAMLVVWLGNYQDGSLDYIYDMLSQDNVVIGLGDGGAHYGMVCDASYSTHVLTHWCRDREGQRMTLGQAAKALAADPAKAVGFLDRGILAAGYKADLNVIDHKNLELCAPEVVHDLPAGGRRINQKAKGIEVTMVAGKIISRNGHITGELPGKLVRGPQPAPV